MNVLSKVPVVFCVLTDNTLEQAQDRSGGKHGNKGVEAAVAAMQMIALRQGTLNSIISFLRREFLIL